MADRSFVELLISAKDKTKGVFQSLKDRLKGVENSANRVKSLGSVVSGLVAGYGALRAFQTVINKTREQESALKQVEARLKSTQGVSGKTVEELQRVAQEFQSITTFGDEAILQMQSLLLTFTNIKGDTFNQATEAILNMSTALGQDLKSSATQLGKALNDPIKGISALSRVGVAFTDEQKNMIKGFVELGQVEKAQAVILKELETEFGGSAKAMADTFGGALDQLGNAFGDLLEADNLGGATAEVKNLTAVLQDPAIKQAFATFTGAVISLTGTLAKSVATLADFTKAIGEMLAGADGAQDGTSELNSLMKEYQETLKGAKEELQDLHEKGLTGESEQVRIVEEKIKQYERLIDLNRKYDPSENVAKHKKEQKEVTKEVTLTVEEQKKLTEQVKKTKEEAEAHKKAIDEINDLMIEAQKIQDGEDTIPEDAGVLDLMRSIDDTTQALKDKADPEEVTKKAKRALEIAKQLKETGGATDQYIDSQVERIKESLQQAKDVAEGVDVKPKVKPEYSEEEIKNLANDIKGTLESELNKEALRVKIQAEIDKTFVDREARKAGRKQ